ncbi:MAG: glycerol-3-phosphate dehydrogenase [Hyphomicrobiaceae bacterium]
MNDTTPYDVLVIGGGINGAGIARDAAGRGYRVLLAEQGDLAGATSSASSKLIHGGLRYLEHYEFRLVREALAEREALLAIAGHIAYPLRFIIPHAPEMRPVWLIRLGLLLYDNLARRRRIPGSSWLDLASAPAGAPLKSDFRNGFAYWDCWVDDARLVVLNARSAADLGAEIATRTQVVAARPASDGGWLVDLETTTGARRQVKARALVNAAGPWVDRVMEHAIVPHVADAATAPRTHVTLVKGSHLVVPRLPGAEDAYLLQSPEGRVIFVLPFEERFSLIGTTDMAYSGDPAQAEISAEETGYLLDLVGRFFKAAPTAADIVWTFSGVRPLLGADGSESLSKVTRDYRLELSEPAAHAPMLAVYGGKITTYRKLAEAAMARLAPKLGGDRGAWTATRPLPGGDLPEGGLPAIVDDLARDRPGIPRDYLRALAHRHGTLSRTIIGDATRVDDLGAAFGGGLFAREVDYLRRNEWARAPDDVMWRRTKAGLHMTKAERAAAYDALAALL